MIHDIISLLSYLVLLAMLLSLGGMVVLAYG